MAIRPIDMQVMLPRMGEVGRIAQEQRGQAENLNNQFAHQLQKTVNQEGKQVVSAPQTHEADVEKDGRSGDKYQQNRRKRRNGADDKNDAQTQTAKANTARGVVDYRI